MPKDGPKRYLFPSPIDPGAYRCALVFLPDDPLYFAAFWASFEYLTKWKAWGYDDLHSGRLVASVWQTAFNMSRARWLEGDCNVSTLDLRTKPGQPGVMQATTDGEHWHDALDTCSCTEPDNTQDARVQVIEQIVRYWFQPLMKTIVDAVGNGWTKEQWIGQWIADNPGFYVSPATKGAMSQLWDTTTPTAGEDPSDWLSDCKYITIAHDWLNNIKTHCEADTNLWDCLQDAWFDSYSHIENVVDVAFATILTSVGVKGLWSDAIKRGECVGDECDAYFMSCNSWTHTFDFTHGETHEWTSLKFLQVGPDHPAHNGYFGDTEATFTPDGWYHPVNPNYYYATDPTLVGSDMFVQMQSPYLYGAVIGGVAAEIVVHTPLSVPIHAGLAMMKSFYTYKMGISDFHEIAPPLFLYAYPGFTVLDGVPAFPVATAPTEPQHNLIVGFWVDNTFGDRLPDLLIKSITLSGTGIDPFYGMP